MLRSIGLLLSTLALASGAHAASLAVSPDKLTYHIGETITLSVYGDAEGASAYTIYGRLVYNGALVDNGTRSQKLIGSGWVKGALEESDTNAFGPTTASSDAFDQIHLSGGFQTATDPIATVTLIARSVGIVHINWDTTGAGLQLNYFGLTSAPGTGFCIVGDGDFCPFVPEPATGTLVALGLLTLAAARRGRPR